MPHPNQNKMSSNFDSVNLLVENTADQFIQASDILIRFCDNVLRNPTEPKYRRLRLANPIIQNKLLNISGGMECLFDMGFLEDGDYLSLPNTAPLYPLQKIRDDLSKEKEKRQKLSSGTSLTTPVEASTSTIRPAISDLPRKEVTFFMKVQSSFDHVLVYEDPSIQQKAREKMPISSFQKEADDKYQKLMAQNAVGVKVKDLILLAMMNWFKNLFFSWVNCPACDRCGGETKQQGSGEPTPEELRWGGNKVEIYRCESCSNIVRFPRYNHPGKLLETRKGRCGEWANCFTLCCRALGFEARYVLDWTDHVWTEVFNEEEKRWIHFDPCENICDKPLLYESGWGKKLTYVIAFSKDDIQDVSWRYSANHESLKQRRLECREDWLISKIVKLRKQRQASLSEIERKKLEERCICELVELLLPQSADSENLPGRLSGSVAWRLARGELGSLEKHSYVFCLTKSEIETLSFHLKYNCASDKYIRSDTVLEKWEKGVFESHSVIRKVEQDWNMAYLARAEGTSTADVSWKFDFQGFKIDTVEIYSGSYTFETGSISWSLCAGDTCILLKGSENNKVRELRGESNMMLTARLSGGRGSVAWQHTQLFRQSTNDTEVFPLEIKVKLMN